MSGEFPAFLCLTRGSFAGRLAQDGESSLAVQVARERRDQATNRAEMAACASLWICLRWASLTKLSA